MNKEHSRKPIANAVPELLQWINFTRTSIAQDFLAFFALTFLDISIED